MKIQPIATPAVAIAPAGTNSSTAQDARARAIARLTDQSPVQNQNAIAPEELGAITATSGQNHSDEEIQAQTAEVDSSTEVVEEPAKPVEEPLSAQHLALIRREKALRAQAQKQEQAYKAREQALIEREAQLAKPSAPDYSNHVSKDQIKQNALQVLADAGVSYEELTQQILNQSPVDPRAEARAAALEAKIAKLEQAAEDAKKSQATAQDEQYKAALLQIESDVQEMVDAGDDYEMIKVTNSTKDVVDYIEAHFKKTGKVMDSEMAAQRVEEYLLEEAEKLAKTKKMIKRLTPATSTQAPVTQAQTASAMSQKQVPQMKTLTNTNSSSRQMTARERALLAFRGELK